MNDTQQNVGDTTNQDATTQDNQNAESLQTVELEQYNQDVLIHLQNIENSSVLNGFFLGAILGSIFISYLFRNIKP